LDLPLGAGYTPPADNREKTAGKAIGGIEKARLRVGAVDKTMAVDPGERAAVFEVDLPAGPAELQTWLISRDGSERGAYYVYAEKLGNSRG
jgi:hypothetical protein